MAVTRALHLVLKLCPKTLLEFVPLRLSHPLFRAKIEEAQQESNETLSTQFSPLLKLARVLVRRDHVSSGIIHADHRIVSPAAKRCVAD
jgi:hypothetical protein